MSDISLLDWHKGQPNLDGNEDCVIFYGLFDYQWGDYSCTASTVKTICEMPYVHLALLFSLPFCFFLVVCLLLFFPLGACACFLLCVFLVCLFCLFVGEGVFFCGWGRLSNEGVYLTYMSI